MLPFDGTITLIVAGQLTSKPIAVTGEWELIRRVGDRKTWQGVLAAKSSGIIQGGANYQLDIEGWRTTSMFTDN